MFIKIKCNETPRSQWIGVVKGWLLLAESSPSYVRMPAWVDRYRLARLGR